MFTTRSIKREGGSERGKENGRVGEQEQVTLLFLVSFGYACLNLKLANSMSVVLLSYEKGLFHGGTRNCDSPHPCKKGF